MNIRKDKETKMSQNKEFVEGWTLAQTLGEGAYGE